MLVCGFVSTFCDNYNCLMHAIKKLVFFLDCFVRHVTIQVDIYIYGINYMFMCRIYLVGTNGLTQTLWVE